MPYALAVLLSQISVGSLNDYLDRHADARYQPEKPIPQGAISPRAALLMACAAPILMLLPAALLGPGFLVLSLVGTIAGLAYDLWFKGTPWAPACYILGFLTLLTSAWVVFGRFTYVLLPVYPAGALMVLCAYLAQSLPDVESDQRVGHRGLTVFLGAHYSAGLAGASYLLVALGSALFALGVGRPGAILPIVPGAALMISAYLAAGGRGATRARRRWFFRLTAPALALLAVGLLLAAQPYL